MVIYNPIYNDRLGAELMEKTRPCHFDNIPSCEKVWSPHGDVGEQRSQRQRRCVKKRYPNAGGERNNRTLGNMTENASSMFKYV